MILSQKTEWAIAGCEKQCDPGFPVFRWCDAVGMDGLTIVGPVVWLGSSQTPAMQNVLPHQQCHEIVHSA